MNPNEIKSGFLYAVTSHDDSLNSLEPYLAIETDAGMRFLHIGLLSIDESSDGPHDVSLEAKLFARQSGWTLEADDIWSLWSERNILEAALFGEDVSGSDDANQVKLGKVGYSVAEEAERILRESDTPDGRVSTWIRHSRDWGGSSMFVTFNEDGEMTNAQVTLSMSNPYMLRTLLRWLRVPHHLIEGVTGIDRLGRKIRGRKRDGQGD